MRPVGDGSCQSKDKVCGDPPGYQRIGQVGEQNDKLISSEPGDRILSAYSLQDAVCGDP